MIAKGVLKPTRMNKLEAAYAQQLDLRRHVGEVAGWWFQEIKLRLGDDCQYIPDFFLMLANGEFECHECKGFFRDDAKVKIVAAADKYPFRFYLVRKEKAVFELELVK